jgi:hypothetical protein
MTQRLGVFRWSRPQRRPADWPSSAGATPAAHGATDCAWRSRLRSAMPAVRHCQLQSALRAATVVVIVIYRQEVSPMNAVSAVGAPLLCTIERLR